MSVKYYWEHFKVGNKTKLGSKIFLRDSIVEFAQQYDPQEFHINDDKAKKSIFGGIISSGWQTCAEHHALHQKDWRIRSQE